MENSYLSNTPRMLCDPTGVYAFLMKALLFPWAYQLTSILEAGIEDLSFGVASTSA